MGKLIDLTGMKFGELTVIERDVNKLQPTSWICKCSCGKQLSIVGERLKKGKSRSCGCKRARFKIETLGTHGQSNTRLYRTWHHMRERCDGRDNARNYHDRGITVCEEWQSFKPFMEWAMNNGYREYLTIDRINNDGNYEPGNCRWVDDYVQANNKRNNVYIEIDGIKRTAYEWSRISGISVMTIRNRIKAGKSGYELLKKPKMK